MFLDLLFGFAVHHSQSSRDADVNGPPRGPPRAVRNRNLQAGPRVKWTCPTRDLTIGSIMTSRERFLAVIEGRMPDRVPVTLFICNGGHFINQKPPSRRSAVRWITPGSSAIWTRSGLRSLFRLLHDPGGTHADLWSDVPS
jgi:hypothetical protein